MEALNSTGLERNQTNMLASLAGWLCFLELLSLTITTESTGIGYKRSILVTIE